MEENELEFCREKLQWALEALRSIEWVTAYQDGSKDNALIDRAKVRKALEWIKENQPLL